MIRLVTGGARSGKSSFAEESLQGKTSVTYIATSQVWDEEMKERVHLHKIRRPSVWNTWETPFTLKNCPYETEEYLLDCITLLTTNIFFDEVKDEGLIPPAVQKKVEDRVLAEVEALVEFVRERGANLQMVTNEVGDSIVPENHLSRVFRDVQGRVNQRLGALSDEVYFVICGIAVKIK